MKLLHTFENGQLLYLADPAPTPPPLPQDKTFLFVDNALIATSSGVNRVVKKPIRLRSTPIISPHSATNLFGVYNFGCCVLKVPDGFRIWYGGWENEQLCNVTAFSTDGITWTNPIKIIAPRERRMFRNIIFEDGVYKAIVRSDDLPPRWFGELWTSTDGITWVRIRRLTTQEYGELFTIFRDTDYRLLHRWNVTDFAWTDAEGVLHLNTVYDPFVRTIGIAHNPTLNTNFPPSAPLFRPGTFDSGETQFYTVSNIIQRGTLRLGLLSVLRDDLSVSPTAFGTGYTVLMWSRNGINWERHKGNDPHYFDPNPGKWDGAITWITTILPVGDEVYLYYGGYEKGHKVYTDRAIGWTKIKRDRWVARKAASGIIRTKPIMFDGTGMTLNLIGSVDVRVYDGTTLLADFPVVSGDGLDVPVAGSFSNITGRNVTIEFRLTNAELYGFTIT